MNCADAEILICDYAEGSLAPEPKARLERHLSACPACAGLARDSATAVAFIDRAADVEPPPELITRILFNPPWAHPRARFGAGFRGKLHGLLGPVLQPRFAMGMAMTILSLAMLARFIGPIRPLSAADLNPVNVYSAVEDRAFRAWQRTVKFYENLRFVYQIKTMLRDWEQRREEEEKAVQDNAPPPDERRLPVDAPAGGAGTEKK